ncbi:hypothetical protein [Sphaerotilus microaerophilus]|uniref:Uncharacterized protein n=1 Tax=Sphaerotilus microaerophilus TaxID=2914710 RepID=A0ABM7YNS0_9BURK|nr:hypothetical protein [Sphaerotilus sp. FB-5]BDI06097.1 hypothetical protein CATMQ487_30670 [Sphaerotilus sp. FB-5]
MSKSSGKPSPSWSDAKAKLAAFDRAGLLGLVQDLYAANKDNQAFLHARLQLGDDVLKPYKATIDRWLWPDVFRNQDTSVAKAKKAIADYKKASGTAEGLAELTVFFCERASGFACDVGMDDETYLGALVRMFEQAMKAVAALPTDQQDSGWGRLAVVHKRSQHIGYGVGNDITDLFADHRGP